MTKIQIILSKYWPDITIEYDRFSDYHRFAFYFEKPVYAAFKGFPNLNEMVQDWHQQAANRVISKVENYLKEVELG